MMLLMLVSPLALHVFVFYGFPGAWSNSTLRSRTEALLEDVFHETSKYRDLPVLILTDLNLQPHDSDNCRSACLQGGWLDAALAASNFDPTHYPSHGNARRLDAVFLNKTAASAFSKYSILEDTGIPSHKPIRVVLQIPRFAALYNQLKRPRSFPAVLDSDPNLEAALAEHSFHKHQADWNSAWSARDTDALFKCFNNFAEAFLCERAPVDPSFYVGRGTIPKFIKQPNCGVNRPLKFQGSQTTVEERCLRKFARQIEELQRQAPTGLGHWPHRLRRLWQCASNRAKNWNLKFDISSLDASKNEAIWRADALASKQDHDAIARWRSKIKLDFRHHRRETFKWYSHSYRSVQHVVKDGTQFVADPTLIDKLICAIWSPIFRPPKSEAPPTWHTCITSLWRLSPKCISFAAETANCRTPSQDISKDVSIFILWPRLLGGGFSQIAPRFASAKAVPAFRTNRPLA